MRASFEQASYGVHILRLGQRLIALYGYDPRSPESEQILLNHFQLCLDFTSNLPASQRLSDFKYFIDQIREPQFITPPKPKSTP